MNTFKAKYDALPGDIDAIVAMNLGFPGRSGSLSDAFGYGNNDGYITGWHSDWLAPWKYGFDRRKL